MESFIFAHSRALSPIWSYRFGHSGPKILFIGGVHGNEPEGVVLANGLLEGFSHSFPYQIQLTLIPALNIDGVLKAKRKNGSDVDLNRNLPTKDWSAEFKEDKYFPGTEANSEPENKALVQFIQEEKPRFILSFHSYKDPMLLDNNSLCRKECEILSRATGYIIKDDIGYPTPGALGTYGAVERSIPTLTYELLRDMNFKDINEIHVPAVIEMTKSLQERF